MKQQPRDYANLYHACKRRLVTYLGIEFKVWGSKGHKTVTWLLPDACIDVQFHQKVCRLEDMLMNRSFQSLTWEQIDDAIALLELTK